VIRAEDEVDRRPGWEQLERPRPHPLGHVLEEADRLDRHDHHRPGAVPDGEGARIDGIVHPLEQVVDTARRVQAVVAAVRVRVAVDVGLVVEEAGGVDVPVRLLEAEEARAVEDGRRAEREHGRVRRSIEGRRRDLHPRGAHEIAALRRRRGRGREHQRERPEEAPHAHCAAMTSAIVKGIGLYWNSS
jgi:hypothetical protein